MNLSTVLADHLGPGGEIRGSVDMIAMTRMSCDQRTKDYVARRTKEGKSKKDIIRCLKRYIAREVYRDLQTAIATCAPTGASTGRSPLSPPNSA